MSNVSMTINPSPMKRLLREISLLTLPDEVLSHIITILPPKSAFLFSLTNTRIHTLYTISFTTIDATTPFRTRTLYTHDHVASLLRHTKHLKTLKLCTSLPDIAHSLPLKSLRFCHAASPSISPDVPNIPTLRYLHIHQPLPCIRDALRSVIPQLTALTLTNIDHSDKRFLQHVSDSVKLSNLHHLTLSLSKIAFMEIPALVDALQSLNQLNSLRTLACGFETPDYVTRFFKQSTQHKFFIRISCLLQLMRERPSRTGSSLRNLHIFSPVFSQSLFHRLLPIATDADIMYSFEANSLQLPLSGGCVVTELASIPTMRYLTEMENVSTKLHTFNLVRRELAMAYTHEYIQGLAGVITRELHTFRVQIPFRSGANLDPIVSTLSDIMKLSTRVRHLHISREVVHFAGMGLMPSFLKGWGSVEALYLTAPERFAQDPYPERHCRKFSAWRFLVTLPGFLKFVPRVCPRLKTVMLEEMGSMGDVENPIAMTGVIEAALKAVRRFEHVLPGVDAGTVHAQLLKWRSQFSHEVIARQKFI